MTRFKLPELMKSLASDARQYGNEQVERVVQDRGLIPLHERRRLAREFAVGFLRRRREELRRIDPVYRTGQERDELAFRQKDIEEML